MTMPPVVNVAHLAGEDGRCARCKGPIGCYNELKDDDHSWVERPWTPGERVIEYDCPDGRSRFALEVTGFTVDCVP